MAKKYDSSFSLTGVVLRSRKAMLFLIVTIIAFIVAAYRYNYLFPDHKYPALLQFLKYIQTAV